MRFLQKLFGKQETPEEIIPEQQVPLTVTLPDEEELFTQLCSVNPSDRLKEEMYPIITEKANEKLTALEVVNLIYKSIHEATYGLPLMASRGLHMEYGQKFIQALIPDAEVLEEAYIYYQSQAIDRMG